jgi:hypothetical protein
MWPTSVGTFLTRAKLYIRSVYCFSCSSHVLSTNLDDRLNSLQADQSKNCEDFLTTYTEFIANFPRLLSKHMEPDREVEKRYRLATKCHSVSKLFLYQANYFGFIKLSTAVRINEMYSFRFPAGIFLFITSSKVTLVKHAKGTSGCFPSVKQLDPDSHPSHPSTAKVHYA